MLFSDDFSYNDFSNNTILPIKEPEIHSDIKQLRKLQSIIEENREKVKDIVDTGNQELLDEDNVRNFTTVKTQKKQKDKDEEEEKFNFKDTVTEYEEYKSFLEMKKISKPLLKALTENEIYKPKPIQSACIPYALLGRDICACAHTGSGKTLAFLLPIFEKLMRFNRVSGKFISPRAVIVSPTRELAMQTHKVAKNLSKYINNLTVELVSGGLNRQDQEYVLRNGADVIIATPGRLIDIVHNLVNFDLKQIRFLVLDEADKVLEPDFIEQSSEIVKQCSPNRQVFLFSATMTENVKALATVSLKNPIKIFVNANTEIAEKLTQEFIRVRLDDERIRESMLISLICRGLQVNNSRSLVFMPTKNQCHRMYVLLGLLGVRCAELHSNMTQYQRLDALGRFALPNDDDNKVDLLICTDLASRGLDITDIEHVINYTMPSNLDQYIHRVGRTARAGRSGHAISLVKESDRPLLKQIKSHNQDADLKMRKIDADVLKHYQEKIKSLEKTIEDIIVKERAEKEDEAAQKELEKIEAKISGKAEAEQKRYNWFADMKRKKNKIEEGGPANKDEPAKKRQKVKQENPNKGKAFSRKMEKEKNKKKNKGMKKKN